MKKVKVVISKDSQHAVSDFAANDWYKGILETGETAYVATQCMLNELRRGVRLKEIEPFEFEFDGHALICQEDARFNDYPKGFFDHQAEQMFTIMTGKTSIEEIGEKK